MLHQCAGSWSDARNLELHLRGLVRRLKLKDRSHSIWPSQQHITIIQSIKAYLPLVQEVFFCHVFNMTDPYDAITSCFQQHLGQVLEIEILPATYQLHPAWIPSPLVEDGPSIGILKPMLIKAVLVARARFMSDRNGSTLPPEDLIVASQVLLLFDPEYLAAANFRKRRLLRLLQEQRDSADVLNTAIREEVAMLDSFLTSPLHRHTKSPTLWHHRRWLLSRFYETFCRRGDPLPDKRSPTDDEEHSIGATELAIIMKAGEQHPKNYYAWNYARSLFDMIERKGLPVDVYRSPISQSIKTVHSWCLRHPSDVSGWSFLSHLLGRDRPSPHHLGLVEQTLGFAFDFHWHHESVWTFFRMVLASDLILSHSQRKSLLRRVEETILELNSGQKEASTALFEAGSRAYTAETVHMQSAIAWIERNWTDSATIEPLDSIEQ